MGIGEKLKEARSEKNITLDQLQETTKIQKRYLQAIEEGNFNILPGTFYARAFIKEYANAVGLDPDELIASHQDELPSIGEKRSAAQYTRLQRTQKSSGSSKASAFFSFLPTVIVVLLVIGIIAIAIYLYQQSLSDDPEPNPEEPENNEYYRSGKDNNSGSNQNNDNDNDNDNHNENDDDNNNNNENDLDEEESDAELTVIEEGTGSVPESTFEFINGGEEIQLTINASDDSWLDVENEEGESFYSDFISEDESPLEWDVSDEDTIFLNIGSAPYVDILINDVPLEYPVNEDDYVLQKIWIQLNSDE